MGACRSGFYAASRRPRSRHFAGGTEMKAKVLTVAALCLFIGLGAPAIARAQNRDHDERHDHDDFDRHGYWTKHRASHWEAEHRTWEQRGGYNGYRVPDDRFTVT